LEIIAKFFCLVSKLWIGQIKNRQNLSVDDNVFSFQIPDVPRLGDIRDRKKRAEEKGWNVPPNEPPLTKRGKPKKLKQHVLNAMAIQRGPRKGQPWKPKTYNEVAGYIEKRKHASIFMTDLAKIKDIVLTELIDAIKK